MTLDTALPSSVQEQLERAIRNVIPGISRSSLEVVREVPPSEGDDLDLDLAPELRRIVVSSLSDERDVGVHIHFHGRPAGEVPVIPEQIVEPAYEFPPDVADRNPTYLGELGGGYADLSEALVTTLRSYCNAPADQPEEYFVGDRADLCCTTCYGHLFTFTTYVYYPKHVETVYAESDHELARWLGLPM